MDVSLDLTELEKTSRAIISSGLKFIWDIPMTLRIPDIVKFTLLNE